MRTLPLFSLAATLWFFACPAKAAADWQVIRFQNRDYLTIENVASFYQLRGDVKPVDERIHLSDGRTTLEINGDPRLVTINGVKQWLSFPLVPQGDRTLISRFDLAKTIEPSLRPTMIGGMPLFHTVIIDAGHGGQDRGATSALGYEKDYTLDVIHELKRSLEAKGLRVLLTRDDDTSVSLDGRAERVNEAKDAILVSVHFNSANDGGEASGLEVFAITPCGAASTGESAVNAGQFHRDPGNDFDNASLALATCVQHALLGHTAEGDRGVKRARFKVLRLARAPSVLVEGGFLTNRGESQRINDAAWRKQLAESIAQGVQGFQELAMNKRPPKLLADYRSERLPLAGALVDPATVAARIAVGPSEVSPASNPQSPIR